MKESPFSLLFRTASLALLALGLAIPSAAVLAGEQAEQPNILFILVDDMGYADLGSTGSRHIRTPNLDRLASEGLTLNNAYANAAICSPTRTALATGRYQGRFPIGLEEPLGKKGLADGLPKGQETLASRLRKLGYHTSLIGKWHLGDPPENGPLAFGYDHFFGMPKGAADYFRHRVELKQDVPGDGLYLGDEPVQRKGYLTNLFADEAIRLIEESTPDRPFMISLHFNAPHWPWEGPFDEEVSRNLTSIFHRDGGSVAKYAEMVENMDQNVGRILLALEARGIAGNTLVIFTSDNGGERFSDTWPYVGVKGELLEGGIRVPALVRWPGRIAPLSDSDQVIISMDFVPTLLAAAGGEVVADEFDGENLLPVLLGQSAPVERTLFWRFNAHQQAAVRQGDWKYLKMADQEHLFNLAADARERAELKEKYPEKFAELKQLFATWNGEMLPYQDGNFSEDVKKTYADRY